MCNFPAVTVGMAFEDDSVYMYATLRRRQRPYSPVVEKRTWCPRGSNDDPLSDMLGLCSRRGKS